MLVNIIFVALGMDKSLIAFANIFATVVLGVTFIVGGMIW